MKNYVGRFEKVSKDRFITDCIKTFELVDNNDIINELGKLYDELKMPERGTSGSAGYDLHLPFGITLKPGDCIVIPTGIRCNIEDGWWLGAFPRSGLGFKYRTSIVNTIPVIDSDYYNADNEGHIMIKLSYDSVVGTLIGNQYTDIEKVFNKTENGVELNLVIGENWAGSTNTPLELNQNDRFVQCIYLPHGYDKSEEDKEITNERTNGMGSTGLA